MRKTAINSQTSLVLKELPMGSQGYTANLFPTSQGRNISPPNCAERSTRGEVEVIDLRVVDNQHQLQPQNTRQQENRVSPWSKEYWVPNF